jgi:hypothetical protein
LDELGLSPDDGESLTAAHRRSNGRIWATLRPLCMNVVGNADVVDLLGAMSCLRLIEQKSSKSDIMAPTNARRQVAEVHAGIRPPPEDGQPQDPVFEAYMALTSEAGLFESDLAESFGPEEAKRISQSMPCVATMR